MGAEKTRQFCTLLVEGLVFGIEVEHIQEVLMYQEMTPVPLAPRTVRGLLNLRGQIVTAIEMRTRLGLRERPAGQLPMIVVVRVGDDVVSLLVDEIGDVVDIAADAVERPPETLRGVARALLQGVCKAQGRLVLVLDVRKTIDLAAG